MDRHGMRQKRNFRLLLEYDGGQYHGWQRQQGVLTVQETVESRLEIMLGGPVSVRASGRTDAGVHARGQVVNFYGRTALSPEEIQRGLNGLLPPDIVVLQAEEVHESFHSRFSAVGKIYEYSILNRPIPSALERNIAWHIRQALDLASMREALRRFEGTHDFSSFMATGSSVVSTERTMLRAELEESGASRFKMVFEANGFLRHMVRNIVGTVVEVGRGRRNPADMAAILAGRDRRLAGMTAPAHGLCLLSVRYDGHAGRVGAGEGVSS